MNFSTLQDLVDEEILMDWYMFVEQLPELDLSEFNLDHLEPNHIESLV